MAASEEVSVWRECVFPFYGLALQRRPKITCIPDTSDHYLYIQNIESHSTINLIQ